MSRLRKIVKRRIRNVNVQILRAKKQANRMYKLTDMDPIKKLQLDIESIREGAEFLFTRIDADSMDFLVKNIAEDKLDELNKHEWKNMDIIFEKKKTGDSYEIFEVIVPGSRVDKDFLMNTVFFQKRAKINGFRSGKMELPFVFCQYSKTIEDNLFQEYRQEADQKLSEEQQNEEKDYVYSFATLKKNQDNWSFEAVAHEKNVNPNEIIQEYMKEMSANETKENSENKTSADDTQKTEANSDNDKKKKSSKKENTVE